MYMKHDFAHFALVLNILSITRAAAPPKNNIFSFDGFPAQLPAAQAEHLSLSFCIDARVRVITSARPSKNI